MTTQQGEPSYDTSGVPRSPSGIAYNQGEPAGYPVYGTAQQLPPQQQTIMAQQQQQQQQQLPFQAYQQAPLAQPYIAQPVPAGYGMPMVAQAMPVAMPTQGSNSACCGCTKSCCSVYLNVFLVLMALLAWIACCDVFGGEMHEITATYTNSSVPSQTSKYWPLHFVDFDGNSKKYNDVSAVSSCNSSGQGTVALFAIAFVTLTIFLFLIVARLGLIIKAQHFARTVNAETVLLCFSFGLYLVGVILWAKCLNTTLNYANNLFSSSNWSVTPAANGYGYVVFCFMLLIASLVHMFVIRHDPYYIAMGRVHLMAQQAVAYGGPQQQGMVYGGAVPLPYGQGQPTFVQQGQVYHP